MAGVRYNLFNPDGSTNKPRVVTIFQAWVKVTSGGHTRLEATSEEALEAEIEKGERAGLYCGEIGNATRQGVDPEEYRAYKEEWARVNSVSCSLPEWRLQMRIWVKNLPPERWNEINTCWYPGLHLRAWLEQERGWRLNYCLQHNLKTLNPDYKEPTIYPWEIDTDAAMVQ